jgi:hypothetical protein
MAVSSFWLEFLDRNPRVQSWLSDQQEFFLQIASVAVAYVAFRILRAIGVASWVVSTLETMDHIAIILVFGAFLLGVVRRAITHLSASKE